METAVRQANKFVDGILDHWELYEGNDAKNVVWRELHQEPGKQTKFYAGGSAHDPKSLPPIPGGVPYLDNLSELATRARTKIADSLKWRFGADFTSLDKLVVKDDVLEGATGTIRVFIDLPEKTPAQVASVMRIQAKGANIPGGPEIKVSAPLRDDYVELEFIFDDRYNPSQSEILKAWGIFVLP